MLINWPTNVMADGKNAVGCAIRSDVHTETSAVRCCCINTGFPAVDRVEAEDDEDEDEDEDDSDGGSPSPERVQSMHSS